ncbi:MAG: hypothetical protein JWR32_5277 [Mycobacterium sp.]|jgi:hypothetical protein|nr:hypothetical protein [Mycobacterium sp.]
MTGPPPHVEILSHHYLLLAIPAFVPAIAVVGVVVYVAMRDRRTPGNSEGADRSDKQE